MLGLKCARTKLLRLPSFGGQFWKKVISSGPKASMYPVNVVDIEPNSSGSDAGIQKGDTVVSINGIDIDTLLKESQMNHEPGLEDLDGLFQTTRLFNISLNENVTVSIWRKCGATVSNASASEQLLCFQLPVIEKPTISVKLLPNVTVVANCSSDGMRFKVHYVGIQSFSENVCHEVCLHMRSLNCVVCACRRLTN
jgi:hypothetical protein